MSEQSMAYREEMCARAEPPNDETWECGLCDGTGSEIVGVHRVAKCSRCGGSGRVPKLGPSRKGTDSMSDKFTLNEAIDLVAELAQNEGVSHYGKACTQVLAALTAAAERETKLREENERLQRAIERLEDTNRYQNAEVEDAEAEVERLKLDRDSWERCALNTEVTLQAERQKVTALVEKLIEMRKHTAKAIEHRHGYPKGDAFGDGLVHGHMNHLSALDALGLTPDPLREK